MTNPRITIETSHLTKEALEAALKERGTTLTEWFNDRVAEIAPSYGVEDDELVQELTTLSELENASDVFKRVQKCDWAFTKANTLYLSHNIHPYPAKFIPHIPRNIIKLLSVKGDTVWDPFGGCGTTALEALVLGRKAISSDINPVATLIGVAKTTTLSNEDDAEISNLIERIELLVCREESVDLEIYNNQDKLRSLIPEIPNCEKWFHPNVTLELAYILQQAQKLQSLKCTNLARAAFSKIVLKASYQDGETRYASKPRIIEKGWVLRAYASELSSILNKIRFLATFLCFREGEFITADLRKEDVVPDNSVDLIVTSPPYPNATDYHLYHRFRLFWLGFDPRDLAKKEIGSHLRHQKESSGIKEYLEEMEACTTKMYRGLRPGRYAVLVLGDAIFNGKSFKTSKLVAARAKKCGFEVIGSISREVHATKRSFISPARRLRQEILLVLRKPLEDLTMNLVPPPYKLWPYENVIRKKELQSLMGNSKYFDREFSSVKMNPLQIEKLRRMTFTHGYYSESFHRESSWQAVLENGDAFLPESKRKDPKYATHGLHPYKGKFYPQLAKSLFNIAGLSINDNVLDPFCGSGTVLLESYLNGLNAIGIDLNPLAVKIANAKTDILKIDPVIRDKYLTHFIDNIEKINSTKDNLAIFDDQCLTELVSWFPQSVLSKLGWILREIDNIPEHGLRDFLEICLSSIIRDVSQQDPKDLRIRRRKDPINDAPVKDLYKKKLLEQRARLRDFAKRSGAATVDFGKAHAHRADSRDEETFSLAGISHQSFDCVVTSPPYATALPYIDTDRLSILLLFGMKTKERAKIEKSLVGSREILGRSKSIIESSIEEADFGDILSKTAKETILEIHSLNRHANVGFRRKNTASLLYRYYGDMTKTLANLDILVKNNGTLFFVIGNNKTVAGGKEIIINSGRMLKETGSALGWKLNESIPITVTQENRLHNKNGITENEIIYFSKS